MHAVLALRPVGKEEQVVDDVLAVGRVCVPSILVASNLRLPSRNETLLGLPEQGYGCDVLLLHLVDRDGGDLTLPPVTVQIMNPRSALRPFLAKQSLMLSNVRHWTKMATSL